MLLVEQHIGIDVDEQQAFQLQPAIGQHGGFPAGQIQLRQHIGDPGLLKQGAGKFQRVPCRATDQGFMTQYPALSSIDNRLEYRMQSPLDYQGGEGVVHTGHHRHRGTIGFHHGRQCMTAM